jgi:hypothetical protein
MMGKTKIAAIKLHNARMLRLMEILLHHATQIQGWRTADLHQEVRSASRPKLQPSGPGSIPLRHLQTKARKSPGLKSGRVYKRLIDHRTSTGHIWSPRRPECCIFEHQLHSAVWFLLIVQAKGVLGDRLDPSVVHRATAGEILSG